MEEHFEWVKDVPETVTITKEEYDYLKWFYSDISIVADEGAYYTMQREYRLAGGKIPEGYTE